MKNMVYIQSGGPTSVINTSFYGAIREAQKHHDKIGHIYGSIHGIEGLITDGLIDVEKEDDHQIELLLQTPGSILGTTRRKLPKDIHDPVYMQIIASLEKYNIGYVFINGGNDSMDTCYKISKLCKELGKDIVVMGVPKTIDNDLACTDHSLGFPSAAKYVVNTISTMAMDANCFKKGKVHVIEIMGRNAGWLTAASDLCPEGVRPHLIYLPENPFNMDEFMDDVKKVYDKNGYALVAISEGIKVERDMSKVRVDGFGHAQLGGTSAYLCEEIQSRIDIGARAVEFSIMQRACPMCISATDRKEAIKTGSKAVQAALSGKTGKMVIFQRVSQKPYKIKYKLADLRKVANAEATVPSNYQLDKTRMSDEFRQYLRPLIQGEVKLSYKDGICEVARWKKVLVK